MTAADFAPLVPLALPLCVASLAITARVASDLATQATQRQATRVAQVEGAVSRVAGGIAHSLTGVTASKPADVVSAIRGAAVAQGAAYLLSALPSTLQAAGATKGSVASMIDGEVGRQLLAAGAAPAGVAQPALPAPAGT